jgi:hypothetical protein
VRIVDNKDLSLHIDNLLSQLVQFADAAFPSIPDERIRSLKPLNVLAEFPKIHSCRYASTRGILVDNDNIFAQSREGRDTGPARVQSFICENKTYHGNRGVVPISGYHRKDTCKTSGFEDQKIISIDEGRSGITLTRW